MIQFKGVYTRVRGHVHFKIFVRTLPTETWANCGNLCMSVEEFDAFMSTFKWIAWIEAEKPREQQPVRQAGKEA